MENFIIASFRALRSLFTPGMLGVFVLCLLATVGALASFVTCAGFFFSWLAAHMQGNTFAHYLPWLGGLGSAFIAWFLFPGIMPLFVNFFDARITSVIEAHDYPAATPARAPAFWPELLHDLRFAFVAIFLNILVLPLYLLPVINLFLFYLLNGWLLGREFFVMVARRHLPARDAEILRNEYGRTVMLAGIALTLLATIPIVNLVAPFWGIAVMVHLFHRVYKTPTSELLPPQPRRLF